MRENGNNGKTSIRKVLSGAIRDICWSFDGSKIAVVGEGKGVRESYSRGDGDNGERCRRSDGVVQERVRE